MKHYNKYKNKRTVVNGIEFDSKREADYYNELLLLQKGGIVSEIRLQPNFELQPGYRKNGRGIRAIVYIADFLVTYNDGKQEIIDVKGHKTKEYLLKKKMFEYKYPHLSIKEI